jgi:methyl-accepting chemotaxis protein
MHFLKLQLEFLGLKAPAFSWVVSVALLAYAIYVYGNHAALSRKRQHMLSAIQKLLRQIRSKEPVPPDEGLSQKAYQAVLAVFGDFPLLSGVWHKITSTVISRPGRNGEHRIWVCDDIRIDVEAVMDHHNYKTAPTVISGIGLLATFLAILVALLDVKLTNNKVQGLDLLVQGLSGKFLSSVIAIACATLLIYGEKWLSQPLKAGVAALNNTIQEIIPRLNPVHIMSELAGRIDDHLNATRSFSSTMATELKQGIDESLKPAVGLFAGTVNSLGEILKSNREQDSGVLKDHLTSFLAEYSHSVNATVDRLGDRIERVLGSTDHQEFSRMAASLSETTTLLREMNGRLGSSWREMTDLIKLTKTATAESSESNQRQIEHLTGIVSDLMVQLQERTEGSLERTLSVLASDMSGKVMDLSTQLTAVLERNSEQATERVKGILNEAGTLSARSAEQIASLFERHAVELGKVEQLKTLLDGTLREFVLTINRYGEVSDGMRKITNQVNTGIASLAQVAHSIKETQEATARSSMAISDQLISVKEFTEGQTSAWERIEASMHEYDTIFSHVEEHAKDLLTQISSHLDSYSNTTQTHFSALASTADGFLTRATARISGSVDELSEQLDELHGTLVNMDHRLHAVR